MHRTTSMLEPIRGLSEMVTVSAKMSNSSFPFVTVDYFENLATHARDQAEFPSIMYLPLVQENQTEQWLEYAKDNIAWMRDSRDVVLALDVKAQGEAGRTHSPKDYSDTSVPPYVYQDRLTTSTGELEYTNVSYGGPYMPRWQESPPAFDMSYINQEMLHYEYIRQGLKAIALTRGKQHLYPIELHSECVSPLRIQRQFLVARKTFPAFP